MNGCEGEAVADSDSAAGVELGSGGRNTEEGNEGENVGVHLE